MRLDESEDLPAALAEAAQGRIDVVVDPLFGEPFAAAVKAASFGARIVQLGQGAGAEATISSALIRGKMLMIMGHTNFAAPPRSRREAYARLARRRTRASDGGGRPDGAAPGRRRRGQRLAAGPHHKIVLVP